MKYFPKIVFYLAVIASIALSVAAPKYAILLSILCMLVVLIIKKPIISIAMVIVLIPFANTNLLAHTVRGLGGLSIPFVCILLVGFLVIVLKTNLSLPKKEIVYACCFGFFMLFAAVNSMPYAREVLLYESNSYWLVSSHYFWVYYFADHILTPIAQFLPLVLIPALVHSERHVIQLIQSLVLSLLGLSTVLIVIYLFLVPNKTDFLVVQATFLSFFNQHANGIATFYIIGFPILLAYFLEKRNLFTTTTIVVSLVAIALLFSRTAYAIVIFSALVFLIKTGRKKILPVFLVLLTIMVFIAPSGIKDRAMMGIANNDYVAMAEGSDLSAGRVKNIWKPTLEELLDTPSIIAIGGGSHYFLTMDAHKVTGYDQPHNFYLDTVVKVGLMGLIYIVVYFARLLMMYYRVSIAHPNIMQRNLLSGVLVSLIAYLIRGLTDGSLLPDLNNLYLWVVLGLGIAMVKIYLLEGDNNKDLLYFVR